MLNVVDVGTGSGRWVLEVAKEFPSAGVCGIDLSPIRTDETFPKNAEFRVMDLTQGLKFTSCSVDLVHSRLLLFGLFNLFRLVHGGLTESQWPSYMKEIYRVLKPGVGWTQCIELSPPFAYSENGKLPQDSALGQVNLADSCLIPSASNTCTSSTVVRRNFSCEGTKLNI